MPKELALLVKARVGDSLSELQNTNKRYKRLVSERASICQELSSGSTGLIGRYIELDEEIMEIETCYSYMLGGKDVSVSGVVDTPGEWAAIISEAVNGLGTELENETWSIPPHNFVKRQFHKKISLSLALLLILASLLTGACIPRLYQIIIEKDTVIRVASGTMEITQDIDENSFRSLAEAMEYYNLLSTAPTWIPSGFVLDSVGSNELDGYTSIYAWYASEQNNTQGISVRFVQYQQAESMVEKYETETDGGEERFVNGIRYFISQNKQGTRAVWVNGSCLCSITGPISDKDIKQMIESTRE